MKKITDIFPEEWLHMDGFDEEYAQKWFEGFMANREINNLSELKDYIIYLEDIELCYEDIKKKIADINQTIEAMY